MFDFGEREANYYTRGPDDGGGFNPSSPSSALCLSKRPPTEPRSTSSFTEADTGSKERNRFFYFFNFSRHLLVQLSRYFDCINK